MTRGLKKTVSSIALATAAGLMASSAMAADLGGNCCADLEERVAELEATAARKGNRKVSLTISGQVNKAVMFWDDGHDSDTYVVDSDFSSTRFQLSGSANITPDLVAGYVLVFEAQFNGASNKVNQFDDDAGEAQSLLERHNYVYLSHARLGKVSLGQVSAGADDITSVIPVSLVSFGTDNMFNAGGGMFIRGANGGYSPLTWGSVFFNSGDGPRLNAVRYDTPTLAGFMLSATLGEDDYWDVALRYAGEFNGVRVAAGVAYQEYDDELTDGQEVTAVGASGGIHHVPSGLFVYGTFSHADDESALSISKHARTKDVSWTAGGGWTGNLLPYGAFTVWGEYGQGNAGSLNEGEGGIFSSPYQYIRSVDTSHITLGISQAIDAAAMDLYLVYRHHKIDDIDVRGKYTNNPYDPLTDAEDLDVVMAGARIKF